MHNGVRYRGAWGIRGPGVHVRGTSATCCELQLARARRKESALPGRERGRETPPPESRVSLFSGLQRPFERARWHGARRLSPPRSGPLLEPGRRGGRWLSLAR